MPSVRLLQHSFAGGEVCPELFGRIDDTKYQSGLAACRNFITKPQGPAVNRAGFQFVREVKNSSVATRLISFTYSTDQTMVIEMGAGYFRFHTQGASLLYSTPAAWSSATAYNIGDLVSLSGTNYYCILGNTNQTPPNATYWYALPATMVYEIPNPYAAADLFDIHYVQSADVLTLVHRNYPPQELRRYGSTNWQLSPISFAATISAPSTPSVSVNIPVITTSTVAISIASPAVISWPSHGISSNTPIVFSTTGALPTGITAGTTYYAAYPQSPVTITIATPGVVTWNNHGLTANQTIVFTTTGALPTGLYINTPYYIINPTTNSFQLASSFAGSAIATSGTQSGTHTATAQQMNLNFFMVSATQGGAALNTSGTQSGTHTASQMLSLSNAQTFSYIVTSVSSDGFTESASSTAATVTSNLYQTGVTNTVSWGAVSGASMYNIYKLQAGLYGYIGQTANLSIIDNNIAPDMSKTPPIYDSVFNSTGNYPGAVSYYEQRRVFAGTLNKPQNLWMTKSGTESTMSYCLPVRDDDRIAFRVAAREANTIRHIVPLTQLVLLTSGAEWRVSSNNSDSITPTTISVRPQSYVGAANVQPLIVNNNLIYAAARGGHVRELAYNWQAQGFVTGDVSIRATHLFDNLAIVDMAYAKAPTPIVWMVSSNGNLLGLTYIPDQQVSSWHRHDTDGVFESCTVVAEGNEDMLYCVIRRTINGATKRYVERMASRQFTTQSTAFFVDCGATYSGTSVTTISGLSWLEGKTVNILADGAVHPQRVVTGGSITLDQAASTVQVGLPITADLQTLPVAAQIDSAFGQGRFKNVNRAWIRVYNSGGIFIGPDANHLTEAKQRTTENYGVPPSLKTGEIPIVLTPSWADSGQIFVRQTAPLPLSVVGLTLEVSIGA